MSAITSRTPADRAEDRAGARRFVNPYLSSFGLGLVLLLAVLVMGRGLGATAAFGSVVAAAAGLAAPEWTAANSALKGYFADPQWVNWTVYLIAGAFVGALVSAWLARDICPRIERGPQVSVRARLALAQLEQFIVVFAHVGTSRQRNHRVASV